MAGKGMGAPPAKAAGEGPVPKAKPKAAVVRPPAPVWQVAAEPDQQTREAVFKELEALFTTVSLWALRDHIHIHPGRSI